MAERRARDIQRARARVDTMKDADPRRDTASPSPAAASCVEPDRPWAEPPKVEDAKIVFEQIVELAVGQLRLIESRPLDPEPFDRSRIKIVFRHDTSQGQSDREIRKDIQLSMADPARAA